MKPKRLLLSFFVLLLVAATLLSSCEQFTTGELTNSDDLMSEKGLITVGVQPGLGFTVETRPQVIKTGGSVKFTVKPLEGYKIIGFSHSNYKSLGSGEYEFINVLYPTMIEVYYTALDSVQNTSSGVNTTKPVTGTPESGTIKPVTGTTLGSVTKPVTTAPGTTEPDIDIPKVEVPDNDAAYANSIFYCFNGGTYVGAEENGYMTVFPDITHHQRVNVINGEKVLSRKGYTLIGWNTQPDGSGTHVSLGSRTTLNKKGALALYASWVKWSDEGNFTYTVSDKQAQITGYTANEPLLCIPASLGGYPVTRICAGAFKNLTVQKVIFPDTLQTVDEKAFSSCAFTTLHFFDSIVTITDDSFESCDNFSTIFINQYKAPVYIKSVGKVEAYDSLILSEKKSIVFFAGSSTLYGIDAYRASASFEGTEYDVINLGWTAPRNAIFQIEIITALLGEGDIFIHAPEYMKSYHLMRYIAMGSTAWQVIDCNLDLYSYVDIRTVPSSITSFASFNKTKESSKYKYTYDHYCSSMDLLGYKCSNRPVIHDKDWTPEGSCTIQASLITDTGLSRLRTLYSAIEDKGVKVYLTYPPLNENYLSESGKDPAVRQGYIDRLKSIGFTVIGSPEDFFYDGTYFHDTEYHLVTFGAQEHTDKKVEILKEQMIKDGLLDKDEA